LRHYGSDVVSVDLSENGKMLHVNLCTEKWSDAYMVNVARVNKCDLNEVEYWETNGLNIKFGI
jgi:hypothetical protein